jgi:hypothetical protein
MFRTVTSFVAWTRNLDIGRRLDGKPLTEETQGAGSRRGECVCIRISCESTTTDSQRERAEAQFGGGSSCGSMFTSRTDRGRSHSPVSLRTIPSLAPLFSDSYSLGESAHRIRSSRPLEYE